MANSLRRHITMMVLLAISLSSIANASAWTAREARVSGVTLRYYDQGDGPALLLIHGWGGSTYSWRDMADPLAEQYRVIMVDLMGHGASEKPRNEEYTMARQAELLAEFVAGLGLSSVTLVAHSYGGGVALLLEDDLAEENITVNAMVLLDPVCYGKKLPVIMRPLRIKPVRFLSNWLMPRRVLVRRVLKKSYYRNRRVRPEDVDAYLAPYRDDDAAHALVQSALRLSPRSPVTDFSTISTPTLLIWGAHDRIVPTRFAYRLANEMPNAELRIIEDSGHVPHEELFDTTFEPIREYLSQVLDPKE